MTSRRLTGAARALRRQDSRAERLIWQWLRDRCFASYKFRRQHPFGRFILDFYCIEARLNIETDGFQHGTPEHKIADAERDTWLEQRGVKVLRFSSSHLRREKDTIREAIWKALQERAPLPVPDYCRPVTPPRTEEGSTDKP